MGRIIDISEILLETGLTGGDTEPERALISACIVRAEGAVKRYLKYDPVQATRTEYYPQMDFSLSSRAAIYEVTDTVAYLRRLSESAVDELQIQHVPVRSIISLSIDYDGRSGTRSGSFSELSVEGVDFHPNYTSLDSSGNKVCWDGIIRSEGRWPNVPGSVKIVYSAGFTNTELHGEDSIASGATAGSTEIDASPIMDAVIDETVRRLNKAYSRMKKARIGFTGGAFRSEKLGEYVYSLDTSTLQRLVGGGMDILPETEHKLQEFLNYGWMLAT